MSRTISLYLRIFLFADNLPCDLHVRSMSMLRVRELRCTYLIERPQQPRTFWAEVPAFAPGLPRRESAAVQLISARGLNGIYCCDGAGYPDGTLESTLERHQQDNAELYILGE